MNGVNKPISDNTILSEAENGKIPLPARWQFGVFGVPKKNHCKICNALKKRTQVFPVWVGSNDNLSLLSALKSRFPPSGWGNSSRETRGPKRYPYISKSLKGDSDISDALKENMKQEGSKRFPDKLGSLSANVPNYNYRCLHCFHS